VGAFLLLENKFSECETGAFHILLAGNTAGKEFMIMNKVIITSSETLQFKISEDQWLSVHENIFDPNNWEKAEK